MTEQKGVNLPSSDEIMRRLTAVYADPHTVERFYPLIAKEGGREIVATGVCVRFTLSIHDYVQGMPPMIANLMFFWVPKWIDALIDDKEVAKEAKKQWQKAMDEATSKKK